MNNQVGVASIVLLCAISSSGVLAEDKKRDISHQHIKSIPATVIPLTGTTSGGTQYGVVRIPKDGPVIEQRGNTTIIDNDPADFGVGVTVPVD
jgi:hypothetical protein